MESITADEMLSQLSDIETELFIKPRKEAALMLGADSEVIDNITSNTVIVISGHYREGLPNFIRFSPLLEKNTFIVMKEPNTF
jgi:predicted RNase H-related nuclease YkuK (DUF458 family)